MSSVAIKKKWPNGCGQVRFAKRFQRYFQPNGGYLSAWAAGTFLSTVLCGAASHVSTRCEAFRLKKLPMVSVSVEKNAATAVVEDFPSTQMERQRSRSISLSVFHAKFMRRSIVASWSFHYYKAITVSAQRQVLLRSAPLFP